MHRERCATIPIELSCALLLLLLIGSNGTWAISVGSDSRQPFYAVGSARTVACHTDCEAQHAACCTANDQVACRTDCARSKFHCGQSCGPRMPACQFNCFEGFFDCISDCAVGDGRQLRASCTRACNDRYMGFKGCLVTCVRAKPFGF